MVEQPSLHVMMTKGKVYPNKALINENIGWVVVASSPCTNDESEWAANNRSFDGSNEMAVGSLTFTSSRTRYSFHLNGSITHVALTNK